MMIQSFAPTAASGMSVPVGGTSPVTLPHSAC